MKDIQLNDIFAENGPIKQFNKDYVPRKSQIEAAHMFENSIKNGRHSIFEGPCGCGKSYAYLIPTLKSIVDSGYRKRMVITTAGISLQEQLFYKDVPFAIELMSSLYPSWPQDFKVTLLKGKQNFICLNKTSKLDKFMAMGALQKDYESIFEFINTTKKGDLSELSFIPSNEVLNSIACVDQTDCLKRACEHYNECYYNKHRERLSSSNVIITNYHMLFADDKTGGSILPEYDILVFDEAHEATNIFRDFGAIKITPHTLSYVKSKMTEITNLDKSYLSYLNSNTISSFSIEFEKFMFGLESKLKDSTSAIVIESINDLPCVEDVLNLANEVSSNLSMVMSINSSACEAAKDHGTDDELATQTKIASCLEGMATSVYNIIYIIDKCKSVNNNSDSNDVIWIENQNKNVSLNTKSVNVSDEIRESFFERPNVSCIFTSATISVGGSLEYIMEQLGLNSIKERVDTLIGESPFNLKEQELWYLPKDSVDGNAKEFASIMPHQIVDIVKVTRGGTLCLFTSIKNMKDTYNILCRKLPQYTIYMQGQAPKTKLIERFKDDTNSILLGTRSFFTGVDIPGDSLRCVVIDKFPFPQPTDPVQQKLQKLDNSFFKYSIPEMIITLKQAVGRGVRSINDRCVVAILDGRMSTARYKGRINASFPYEKTGTRELTVVEKFIMDGE